MDRATLPHAKSQLHVPHLHKVKSPGNKCCEQYLKNIATQTVTCWLLAHTYTVRPKLHLVDLLSTNKTSKFATNTQEIEPMELERQCIGI